MNKLKKSSKEDIITRWNMHEILSKLKIRTIQFLVKFLLENRSRVKILSKLTFFSSKILNKLKIRREIEFEAKVIQNFDTWSIFEQKFHEKLNGSNFELSQNLIHIPSRYKSSFDDFLSSRSPP